MLHTTNPAPSREHSNTAFFMQMTEKQQVIREAPAAAKSPSGDLPAIFSKKDLLNYLYPDCRRINYKRLRHFFTDEMLVRLGITRAELSKYHTFPFHICKKIRHEFENR